MSRLVVLLFVVSLGGIIATFVLRCFVSHPSVQIRIGAIDIWAIQNIEIRILNLRIADGTLYSLRESLTFRMLSLNHRASRLGVRRHHFRGVGVL